MAETRKTRPVSWLKAARHEFEKFPEGARMVCLTALTIAAEGGKADIAKPLQGVGSGILEIAVPFKGDAFRVVYHTTARPGYLVGSCFSKEVDHGN
jgi:phage-related protein